MNHLYKFELYEHAKLINMIKGDLSSLPKSDVIIPSDAKEIRKITISDQYKNNKFGIDYNNEIKIHYNNTEEHLLFGEKRLYERTPFENIIEFNVFINDVFNLIYPKYFFETVQKLDDIDIFDTSLSQKYNKTYVLSILNLGDNYYFYITYTLTKKYNEKTNKYDFFIYIITINKGRDDRRIYQEFDFDYLYSTGELDFIENTIIGVKPQIPQVYKNKISDLYTEEHLNYNYRKSITKKEEPIVKPKINVKSPISPKNLSKIMKKR